MNKPAKFRKKPVVIDAVRWDGTRQHAAHVVGWINAKGGAANYHDEELPKMHSIHCGCDGRGIVPGDRSAVACPETEPKGSTLPAHITIDTLEGTMVAPRRSWIVQGVAGEFYAVEPSIFKQTYEEVL